MKHQLHWTAVDLRLFWNLRKTRQSCVRWFVSLLGCTMKCKSIADTSQLFEPADCRQRLRRSTLRDCSWKLNNCSSLFESCGNRFEVWRCSEICISHNLELVDFAKVSSPFKWYFQVNSRSDNVHFVQRNVIISMLTLRWTCCEIQVRKFVGNYQSGNTAVQVLYERVSCKCKIILQFMYTCLLLNHLHNIYNVQFCADLCECLIQSCELVFWSPQTDSLT